MEVKFLKRLATNHKLFSHPGETMKHSLSDFIHVYDNLNV